MRTSKRDKYRRLLEVVFKEIRYNSNWSRTFNDGHLDIVCYNPFRLRDLMIKFEKIKFGWDEEE